MVLADKCFPGDDLLLPDKVTDRGIANLITFL